MTKFACADAIGNLLQLSTDTALTLALPTDQLLAAADEIRLGRCHRKELQIWMVQSTRFEATKVIDAVASAISWDRHLEFLVLQMEDSSYAYKQH
jgi:hypothetical protein